MSVLVGKKAPVFKASALVNGNEIVRDFSLEQYLGKQYVLLFFYPEDFSGVCPSELNAFQDRLEDFTNRNCAVVACSTDTARTHLQWAKTSRAEGGIEGVKYPVVGDSSKTISDAYGILAGDYDYNEEGELVATGPMIAYRGLFLINKEGVVMHELVNHFVIGRDVDETLRMVDAVQHFESHGETCLANWKKA